MNRNSFKMFVLVTPALLFVGACSNSNTDQTRARTRDAEPATNAPAPKTTDRAFVRFVDAHSVAPADLYFGDTKAFSDVQFETVTKYRELPAERHEFALKDAGKANQDPLAKNSEGLGDAKHYTVVAYDDSKNSPSLRVVDDDETAPKPGKAKVRIIHAAPGMEAVELYAAGSKDKLASESRLTTVSNWQEVDPTNSALEVRTSNDKNGTVRIPKMHLEAGKLYTFVVIGGEKANERLRVIPITDVPTKS
jgi:hypothetical protein